MKRWLKCLWERPMLKAELWDYMTCKNVSEQTFIWLALKIRKEARKLVRP